MNSGIGLEPPTSGIKIGGRWWREEWLELVLGILWWWTQGIDIRVAVGWDIEWTFGLAVTIPMGVLAVDPINYTSDYAITPADSLVPHQYRMIRRDICHPLVPLSRIDNDAPTKVLQSANLQKIEIVDAA
jgi:hypothetical protein